MIRTVRGDEGVAAGDGETETVKVKVKVKVKVNSAELAVPILWGPVVL